MEQWQQPDYYIGEQYYDYYVVLSRNRDSGLIENSNFDVALSQLGGESPTVKVVRVGHWAYGWVDILLVHKDDDEMVALAREITDSLANYPVLDDDDYDRREAEEIEELRIEMEAHPEFYPDIADGIERYGDVIEYIRQELIRR